MPLNLELKIKLDFFTEIENILKEIKAEYSGFLNQKDIYYKVKTNLLKLRIENGESSLIFYNREEEKPERFSDYEVITFSKGNPEAVFEKIFETETVVEKKRILYMYDKTRIHLDAVNELGNFLELETLVINGKEDAVKRFNKLVRLLKLDVSNQIRKSYRDLMLEKES